MNSAAIAPAHCLHDEAIDVTAIDWNRVWKAQMDRRTHRKRDSSFWDGRASSFAKSATDRKYSDKFLAIMKPEPHWSVLDMGCGSGTLAVPIAKCVASVTAVDFSGTMLDVLRQQCADEDIRNMTILHGQWEDDWERLGIVPCDVAIASRSMMNEDLQDSIRKLTAVARKRVYIATAVGDGPRDRRLIEAVGRTFVPGPDYIYYYNMLYSMGITANVAFIEKMRNRAYATPEEAAMSMRWMFGDLNPQEEARLADFIREHLVFRGDSWKLSYDAVSRWAVIWWEKK